MKTKTYINDTGYIYENAIRFKRKTTYIPDRRDIKKRGLIKEFTRHTALRLRDALATNTVPNSETFGITLTVPWLSDEINFDSRLNRYDECFNRFCCNLRYALPNSASIFRHELQQRKMPHTHIVIWLSDIDRANYPKASDIKALVWSYWSRAMKGELYGGSMEAFFKYGVKVDAVKSNIAIMRYLCDHTAKSKQAQLGYLGKQWGYINRKFFKSPCVHCFRMTPQQALQVSRTLSRLSRFSLVKGVSCCSCDGTVNGLVFRRMHTMARSCPFGSKKIPRHKLNSVVFLNKSTSLKLFKFLGIRCVEVDLSRPF